MLIICFIAFSGIFRILNQQDIMPLIFLFLSWEDAFEVYCNIGINLFRASFCKTQWPMVTVLRKMTPEFLSMLKSLKNAKRFHFEKISLELFNQPEFSVKTQLTELHLVNCTKVVPMNLQRLPLQHLKTLVLRDCSITDLLTRDLFFTTFPSLESLELGSRKTEQWSSSGFRKRILQLRPIQINHTFFRDCGLHLRVLCLDDVDIDYCGFKEKMTCSLSTLEQLSLVRCSFLENFSKNALSFCTNVQVLNIIHIRDRWEETFLFLKDMPALHTLSALGSGLLDTDLSFLEQRSGLNFLDVSYCRDLTDVSCRYMSQTKHLVLGYQDSVTSEGISNLVGVESLHINYSKGPYDSDMLRAAHREMFQKLPCLLHLRLCIHSTSIRCTSPIIFDMPKSLQTLTLSDGGSFQIEISKNLVPNFSALFIDAKQAGDYFFNHVIEIRRLGLLAPSFQCMSVSAVDLSSGVYDFNEEEEEEDNMLYAMTCKSTSFCPFVFS